MTSSLIATSRRVRLDLRELSGRSPLALMLIVIALLTLTGTAVLIARGDASEEVAQQARILTWSNSLASSTQLMRSEIREGLLVGIAVSGNLIDADEASVSADRIRVAGAELLERAEVLSGLVQDGTVSELATTVDRLGDEVADAIGRGDRDAAVELAQGNVVSALASVSTAADQISEDSADVIIAANSGLNTITTAARFVSALLIPVLAVFMLYRALRRSEKTSILRSELAREKELRHKKDSFLAAASHHIRTPLSAVVGFAELLRDRTSDFSAGVRNEVTELLAQQAQETAIVVDDLMAAARHDLGQLNLDETPIEIREILDEATRDWRAQQRLRLTIKGNARIVGDERWLTQALRNVLRNAASFGGEEINVEIRTVTRRVLIDIADNGDPIPFEEHSRMFDQYYSYRQIEGLAPSLGLGLAVARRIVRASGGDMRFTRRDDQNVFELWLPTADADVTSIKSSVTTIDPAEGRPTEEAIRDLLASESFETVYQPIVDMTAWSSGVNRVIGYEALARFGEYTPPVWFETASSHGLRLELELACIRKALAEFDVPTDDVFLTVNLSDRTLQSSLLNDAISGIDPQRLILELSESASIKSYEETLGVVEALEARGVRLAVDDMGSRELDLWHMIRLGAHMIKIDISLVRDIVSLPRNRAIVRALSAIGNELGRMVVAEGVETEEEHSALVRLGVSIGQGYLYGRPSSIQDATPLGVGSPVYKAI